MICFKKENISEELKVTHCSRDSSTTQHTGKQVETSTALMRVLFSGLALDQLLLMKCFWISYFGKCVITATKKMTAADNNGFLRLW